MKSFLATNSNQNKNFFFFLFSISWKIAGNFFFYFSFSISYFDLLFFHLLAGQPNFKLERFIAKDKPIFSVCLLFSLFSSFLSLSGFFLKPLTNKFFFYPFFISLSLSFTRKLKFDL